MEWKYVKPIISEDIIKEFEGETGYCFPDDFLQCVLEHNGGRPNNRTFNTEKTKERELKSFLSFNKNDKETVWKIMEWNKEELSDRYVAFAIDNFGNLICFDTNNDCIVFVNLEIMSVEKIANSFHDFINCLYN